MEKRKWIILYHSRQLGCDQSPRPILSFKQALLWLVIWVYRQLKAVVGGCSEVKMVTKWSLSSTLFVPTSPVSMSFSSILPLFISISSFWSFLSLPSCLILHCKYFICELLMVTSCLCISKNTVSTHCLYAKSRWLNPIQ